MANRKEELQKIFVGLVKKEDLEAILKTFGPAGVATANKILDKIKASAVVVETLRAGDHIRYVDGTIPIADNPVTQTIYSITLKPNDTVIRLQSGMVLTRSTRVQRVFDRVANKRLPLAEVKWRRVEDFQCEEGAYGESLQAKLQAKLQEELLKHKDNLMTSLLHPSVRALAEGANKGSAASATDPNSKSKPKFQFDVVSDDSLSSSDESDDATNAKKMEAPRIMSAEERKAVEADRAKRDVIYQKIFGNTPTTTTKATKPSLQPVAKPNEPLESRPVVQKLQTSPAVNSFASASELVSKPIQRKKQVAPAQADTEFKSKFFAQKKTTVKPVSAHQAHANIKQPNTVESRNRRSAKTSASAQNRRSMALKRKKASSRSSGKAKKPGKKPGKKTNLNPIVMLKAVPVQWEIEEPNLSTEPVVACGNTANASNRSVTATPVQAAKRQSLSVLKTPMQPGSDVGRQISQTIPAQLTNEQRNGSSSVGRLNRKTIPQEPSSIGNTSARNNSTISSNPSISRTPNAQQTIDTLLRPASTRKNPVSSNAGRQQKHKPVAEANRSATQNQQYASLTSSSRKPSSSRSSTAGNGKPSSISPSTFSRCGIQTSASASTSSGILQRHGAVSLNSWSSSESHGKKDGSWESQRQEKRAQRDPEPIVCNLEKQFELASRNAATVPSYPGSRQQPRSSLLAPMKPSVRQAIRKHPSKNLVKESPVCSNQTFSPLPAHGKATALYTPATEKKTGRLAAQPTKAVRPEQAARKNQEWACNLYLDLLAAQRSQGEFVPLEHILLGIHELGLKDVESLYFDLPGSDSPGERASSKG